MVKISPLSPLLPRDPKTFCTNPYDVIEKEEECELKKNPHSLVHVILPDGEGDTKYANANSAFQKLLSQNLFEKTEKPSIFIYRQESPEFSQEGFILGLSLNDYEQGTIVKHEKTREKPLLDRIKIYNATKIIPGLVWTVYKSNPKMKAILEQIKHNAPKFKFEKYGYLNILWQESDPLVITQVQEIFKSEKVYIADGHHRAAAAADYRKNCIKEAGNIEASWQYLMAYVASDDQVRILPYNRVIKKIPLAVPEFIERLKGVFHVIPKKEACSPQKKHQIAMNLQGSWYLLEFEKQRNGPVENLDVSILQDLVLDPLLGIKDPRSDENIFFVGGITDPISLEKFITVQKNALLFSLYPVNIKDLEKIADSNNVMPPKSTWFDPKLLSGMLIHQL